MNEEKVVKMNNKKNNKSVSIIVPVCSYRKAYATIECLLKQKYPSKYEIIYIYDNRRVPLPLGERWKLKKDRVRVIINKENRGLAGNYNDGIKAAKYSNIITLHEDMVTNDPLWVAKMLHLLERYQVVNALVKVPQRMFAQYDFWNKMMLFRYAGIVTPAIGKATAFRKSLFYKIGLWDEEIFKNAGEDMDYNVRLINANITSGTFKEVIYHEHEPPRANIQAMFKKEWQMGDAHGAFKKKYPFEAAGFFDMEMRLGLIVLTLFFSPLFLLPFFAVSTYQAIKGYANSNWLPGALIYPFLGTLVLIVQTIAACRSWLLGRQGI